MEKGKAGRGLRLRVDDWTASNRFQCLAILGRAAVAGNLSFMPEALAVRLVVLVFAILYVVARIQDAIPPRNPLKELAQLRQHEAALIERQDAAAFAA